MAENLMSTFQSMRKHIPKLLLTSVAILNCGPLGIMNASKYFLIG